ncbi:hypothetical protein JTB14_033746 [Gonioctena quinquepunctata]|nr:hypothetical protein JTB14_033746 [Gonioctena quinquepunctata]
MDPENAFGKKCSKCGIENHFAVSCRVKSIRNIEQSDASSSADSDDLFVNRVRKEKYTDREVSEDFCANLSIEKEKVKVRLDTGADVSVIPLRILKKIDKQFKMRPTQYILKGFEGSQAKPIGIVNLHCSFKNREIYEDFVIVDGANQVLVGCQACINLKLIKRVNNIEVQDANLCEKYEFINKNPKLSKSFVICHDDMIVHGKTRQEHDLAVAEVVKRATEFGAKFNKDKFQYCQSQVKFMGQIFSQNGMQIDSDKVESLCKLKTPTNRVELQRVIGSFNYVRRYVKNMSELMHPLCQLLRNNVEWLWLPKHQQAFDQLKEVITKTPALVPFDPERQTVLQCDASKNGLGCCKNIQFADMLSRSSLQIQNSSDPDMFEMIHLVSKYLPMSQEKKDQFRLETNKDSTLLRINDYYYSGWPKEQRIPADCKPYYGLKDSIYVEAGIIFVEDKIIVPQKLRTDIIKLLHKGHVGISKTMNKARTLFYWSSLSNDITNYIESCRICEKYLPATTRNLLCHIVSLN